MGDRGPAALFEVQRTLGLIRDVVAVKVSANDRGQVAEVHLLARSGRSPVHIARDAESVLVAHFGFDPGNTIKVTQIGRGFDSDLCPARMKLDSVNYVVKRAFTEVRVRIGLEGEIYEGVAKGVNSENALRRAAAVATIRAVEAVFESPGLFSLEEVLITNLGPRIKTAVVGITLFDGCNEQILTGSCPVRQDSKEAIVKATLDAINRQFAREHRKA